MIIDTNKLTDDDMSLAFEAVNIYNRKFSSIKAPFQDQVVDSVINMAYLTMQTLVEAESEERMVSRLVTLILNCFTAGAYYGSGLPHA